ncbi:LITAF-like zinc ribbon domain-containing protein [Thelonectria olida]|uniref:LITAF-like zinc ribbon domain-containing protein n=1 Tax=Thelonectria olida TaxID=1576542 RepID=A0A9P8VWW0_9HYPO|nr:LITAF-like zinc ribbon domain-containing protein [Thelonectria olida]
MDSTLRTMFPAYSDHDGKTGPLALESSHRNKTLLSFDGISQSTVVPLTELKLLPRAIVCPACQESSITRIERKICAYTHVIAGFLFLCTIVGGPVPYFSERYKDAVHYCCRCNKRLATFHPEKGTELHVY